MRTVDSAVGDLRLLTKQLDIGNRLPQAIDMQLTRRKFEHGGGRRRVDTNHCLRRVKAPTGPLEFSQR